SIELACSSDKGDNSGTERRLTLNRPAPKSLPRASQELSGRAPHHDAASRTSAHTTATARPRCPRGTPDCARRDSSLRPPPTSPARRPPLLRLALCLPVCVPACLRACVPACLPTTAAAAAYPSRGATSKPSSTSPSQSPPPTSPSLPSLPSLPSSRSLPHRHLVSGGASHTCCGTPSRCATPPPPAPWPRPGRLDAAELSLKAPSGGDVHSTAWSAGPSQPCP
ncbi:hypothetical protein BS50DRAFT_656230, partial [Corynespora cassiicola Philippines]